MSEYHPFRLTRFDFDVVDFLGSEHVAAMNSSEVGQYVLLLCQAWIAGSDATLPNDPKLLAKYARCRKVSPAVMRKFVETSDGRLHNPRLSKEWGAARQRAAARQEKAKKAAESRWKGDAQSMPQASSKHCSEMPPFPFPSPKEKPLSPKSSHSDEAISLASLLKQRILENNGGARITAAQERNWVREADRMIRRDGRREEEIRDLIDWTQQDEFWHTNILSMAKLREKWDQLVLKRRARMREQDCETPVGLDSDVPTAAHCRPEH